MWRLVLWSVAIACMIIVGTDAARKCGRGIESLRSCRSGGVVKKH